ncbi:TIGR03546 family protein [Stieleria sp. JC731]|uniref:TIGR03546 family protein n=1 Tax=Pirellulaceae TaxID=2691357 RepID=UPI001E5672FB|nr:TIGR03546 family protein [Stieleria sp. JC731]MCC9599982.1 TIGR03546 family protein [Stieleria sp. JC731]
MVVFSLKLLNNLRKAIADRRFPKQLAAGCAFGVLLGIIPHGNLLAVLVLLTLLTFQINHALMAAVAIGVSFAAPGLDEYSHQLGEYLLNHPQGHQFAVQAWTFPLMPWTDLNNTVVLGSFLIGVVSVWPVYRITLPFFRYIAPVEEEEKATDEASASDESAGIDNPADGPSAKELGTGENHDDKAVNDDSAATHPVSVRIDDSQSASRPPRWAKKGDKSSTEPLDSVLTTETHFITEEAATGSAAQQRLVETATADQLPPNEQLVSVETKIDVIRMKDYRDQDDPKGHDSDKTPSNDEALNYLLQQLRHSQQRKAAG